MKAIYSPLSNVKYLEVIASGPLPGGLAWYMCEDDSIYKQSPFGESVRITKEDLVELLI